jgi:hypothetical protein
MKKNFQSAVKEIPVNTTRSTYKNGVLLNSFLNGMVVVVYITKTLYINVIEGLVTDPPV